MAKIFIQIAAYRDLETNKTILDAVKQSTGNHEINFGVHICYLEDHEKEILDLPNIKYAISKAPKNIGLGIGRTLAHQFYNGEDYYLQVDSHTRFVQGWDEICIHSILDYQIQGIEKPIISTYPGNYWYETVNSTYVKRDILDPNNLTNISFHEKPEQFKGIRIPSQTAIAITDGNKFSKSVSGGSIFMAGGFLPFNTEIAFYGEEIWLAARAYTHGYDLFVPNEQYMWHLYYNWDKPPEINKRKLLWQDFPNEFNALDKISKELIYKTLSEGTTGDLLLGTKRTLAEYGTFCGLDFENGLVLQEC